MRVSNILLVLVIGERPCTLPLGTQYRPFLSYSQPLRLKSITKRECILDAAGVAQHLLSSFSLIAINPSVSALSAISDLCEIPQQPAGRSPVAALCLSDRGLLFTAPSQIRRFFFTSKDGRDLEPTCISLILLNLLSLKIYSD
jgi:hypothetical protein